jgi:hypothetical protein
LKARMAKPGNFHVSNIRFTNKFGRGLLSSPEFYCTTRMGVPQGYSPEDFGQPPKAFPTP